MTTPSEEEARALLVEQIAFPDSTLRMHRHGGYVQAMSAYEIALVDALEALLASRVSTPPSEVKPWAWAIRGLKTGRIREVTDDDEYADECRAFYDVIPLVPAVPVLPTPPCNCECHVNPDVKHIAACCPVPVLPTEPEPLLDADGEPTGWAYRPAPVRPRPAPTEPEEKR